MKSILRSGLIFRAAGLAGGSLGCSAAPMSQSTDETSQDVTSHLTRPNGFGTADYFSVTGAVDQNQASNPFFRDMGINGRTCNSCHKLEDGLGISVARINSIFTQTNGLDPIFRINDGSNAPTGFYANTSTTLARRTSFSMLLNHGVIRVGIGVPANPDYNVTAIQDPYGFASAAELSLFRRPLPSVNVKANVLAMWDGRESEGRPAIRDALINQANDATQGHAQRPTPLDTTTRQQIADFQLNLYNAQVSANSVGRLDIAPCAISAEGEECEDARGGAQNVRDAVLGIPGSSPLIGSPGGSEGPLPIFSEGVNSPFGKSVCLDGIVRPASDTSCFKNVSLTVFDPFESDVFTPADAALAINVARGELGDGENLFYTKVMFFNTAQGGTAVPGLSDRATNPIVKGTCTTCHNTPEVGSHSMKNFFATGVGDPFAGPHNNPLLGNGRTLADFPLYTFDRKSNGQRITTTDPGLALRTGKWADVGKFKVPNLRGLGSRAPYFHNGVARTLDEVVKFYNIRFNMGLTTVEAAKIVKFLQQT